MLHRFQSYDRWEFTCSHKNNGLIEPHVCLNRSRCLTRDRFQSQFTIVQCVPVIVLGFSSEMHIPVMSGIGREERKRVFLDFEHPMSSELPVVTSLWLQIHKQLTDQLFLFLQLEHLRKLQYQALPIDDVLWNKKFLVMKIPKTQGLNLKFSES